MNYSKLKRISEKKFHSVTPKRMEQIIRNTRKKWKNAKSLNAGLKNCENTRHEFVLGPILFGAEEKLRQLIFASWYIK